MTISSETRKAGPFYGNDAATSFPFTFKIFEKSDLLVILTSPLNEESVLILDSDYEISLNPDQDANPGGAINYPISGPALPSEWRLTAVGNLEYLQLTDITNQGGFYPQVIENTLDRLTMLIQQLAEGTARSIKVSISSEDPSLQLSDFLLEALKDAQSFADIAHRIETRVVTTSDTAIEISGDDCNTHYRCTAATPVTITLLLNDDGLGFPNSFPLGYSISAIQLGAGVVSIVGAIGVTINKPASSLASAYEQGSSIGAIYAGNNSWDLTGDLGAA